MNDIIKFNTNQKFFCLVDDLVHKTDKTDFLNWFNYNYPNGEINLWDLVDGTPLNEVRFDMNMIVKKYLEEKK